MGKRLFRIFKKDIPARIKTLAGIELNLILSDNRTLHGIITEASDQEVLFKDFMGVRQIVPLEKIYEIIFDKESAY